MNQAPWRDTSQFGRFRLYRVMRLFFVIAAIGCGDNKPAPVPPLPACDYNEQTHDIVNGQPTLIEMTGLAQPTVTLCGQVDPGATTVVDFDRLQFVAPPGNYNLRLWAPDAPAGVQLEAFVWELDYNFHGWAAVTNGFGHGIVDDIRETVTLEVWFEAHSTAPIAAPFEYRVQMSPVDLATIAPDPGDDADYVEQADGADSQGNDVMTYAWPPQYGLTSATTDAPEETGLVVSAGDVVIIEGIAGLHSKTDLYYEHDTYAFDTSDDVRELHARLLYDDVPDPMADKLDMDMFILEPSADGMSLRALGSAQDSTTQGPDPMTAAVAPETRLWLTVANWVRETSTQTMPRPYRVVLYAL